MISDTAAWTRWENEQCRREPVDLARNLRLFEAMYQEAQAMGVLARIYPLDGIEVKIGLARALNVSGATDEAGTGA
jgi:hypothetical protein